MATTSRNRHAGRQRRAAGTAKTARRASGPIKKAAKGTQKARKAPEKAAKAVTPGGKAPVVGKLARFAARKALKAAGKGALRSVALAVRKATEQVATTGRSAYERAASNRLPIQIGLDVAVPIQVAWEEWMSATTLTEGVQRIEDVQRDGDVLIGTLAGPRGGDWEAEIVDERDGQSFAWRSVSGTDCAGLVTFHVLSDRLTRVELDLDVLPTNPAQVATLSLRLANRRAEAHLRRFKAHVEFINPDEYEPDQSENGDEPESNEED